MSTKPAWAHEEPSETEVKPLQTERLKEIGSRLKDARVIPVEQIDRDEGQPRRHFDQDELERLAQSLKKRQLQPIGVYRNPESRTDRYTILFGERRWRAAQIAGLATLDCIVFRQKLTSNEVSDWQFEENDNRQDFTTLEKALHFRRRMEKNNESLSEFAKRTNLSKSMVSKTLAILKLPEDEQQLAAKLSQKQIACLLDVENREERIALVSTMKDGDLRASTAKATREKRADRTSKKRTVEGAVIRVTAPVPLSNLEVARRLRTFADRLVRDGRCQNKR